MGQQLSGESYCRTTMQKLLAEINTTDSRVSESHVTWCGSEGGEAAMCVDFTWREWARVSKYMERVLPCSEQKRLLNYVLLDRTGLRHCRQEADATAADAEPVSNGQLLAGGGNGWSVHVNYGDDFSRNPILYRDFVKLHFQLDGVPGSETTDNNRSNGNVSADQVGKGGLDGEGDGDIAERLADLVKRRCGSIGINLLVTKAKHHAGQSCVVVSGTVDVRSVLRYTDQLELRSRLNAAKAEDQELSDQLFRSAAGLRDRIDGAAASAVVAAANAASGAAAGGGGGEAAAYRYFPMRLSYSEATNRVTLVYAQEARTATEASTVVAAAGNWTLAGVTQRQ